ncbi:hypothetical protein JCM11491_002350 [Sporobolomyces phaffii]
MSQSQVVNNKSTSYSFVTEPDPVRFLVDLPIRPTTPDDAGSDSQARPTLANPNSVIISTPSSPRSRFTTSTLTSSRPVEPANAAVRPIGSTGPVDPLAASSRTVAMAPSPPPSTASPSPTPATRQQRSASKSKNRLSATITGLLGKSRSRSASKGAKEEVDPEQRSASSAFSAADREAARRTSTSSSRRGSHDGDGSSPSPSLSPPTNAVTLDSAENRSKPPVSLPSSFRRRTSSSSQTSPASQAGATPSIFVDRNRDSLDRPRDSTITGLGLSSSSLGSSDGAILSDGSTAATSPDLETAEVTTPRPALSSAEKRRRSSLVLAHELGERRDDEEDLSDFVRASGTTSPSPNLQAGPFARRPSNSTSFPAPTKVSPEPAAISSPLSSTSPVTIPEVPESTIAARRQNRNLESLNLGDLGRRSPAPLSVSADSAHQSLPSGSPSSPSLVPLSPSNDAQTRPRSTTQARLQALPRLLSMDVIPNSGRPAEEEEQEPDEETESEAEDGETEGEGESQTEVTSDDEGDRYASADEAPVVSRVTTPAQTPRPASQQTSFDRYATSSASGPPRIPSLTGLSALSSGSPTLSGSRPGSSWVTFAPATPGIRTARPQPSSTNTAEQSYFDLPRPSGASNAKTPLIPPQTPLAPMSISDVARGKRPALQEEVDDVAEATHSRAISTPGLPQMTPKDDSAGRNGLYRLRSQSVVALMSPSMVDSDEEPIGTASLTGLDPVWRTGGLQTPGPSFLAKPTSPPKTKTPQSSLPPLDIPRTPGPPPTPTHPASPHSPIAASPSHGRRPSAATNRLHRPRSMYELRNAPPAYTSIARQPGFGPRQDVQPREEEGKEGLPQYTCSIHIEGFMPRKMEFTAPGMQAKDRAWKRQYIVLHGTSIKVYKYDLRTHPIPGEEDWSTVPVDIAGKDGPPPLHFHQGEYGVDNSAHGSRFPLSIEDAKAKAKSRIIQQATASSTNLLLRHYSLQNAESGLAADYIKRKHVVRVRAEGEQFLLQAKDDRGVIDLIEALQAATNVALDLDARPLPKFITLPRRRRRRRPRPDAAAAAAGGATTTASDPSSTAASAFTSSASTAAEPPSDRQRRSPDRLVLLPVTTPQRALATGNDATIM